MRLSKRLDNFAITILLTLLFGVIYFQTNVNASETQYVVSPLSQPLEKGVFLVASRKIDDPRFKQTVILLTGYGKQGALGLIINRPTELKFSDLSPNLAMIEDKVPSPYIGGPVHPRLFSSLTRTKQPQQDMSKVIGDVYFVLGTRQVIESISRLDREHVRVYAGYSGWLPGQLEMELARGDWYIVSAQVDDIFSDAPEKIWQHTIKMLFGVWV